MRKLVTHVGLALLFSLAFGFAIGMFINAKAVQSSVYIGRADIEWCRAA